MLGVRSKEVERCEHKEWKNISKIYFSQQGTKPNMQYSEMCRCQIIFLLCNYHILKLE